MSVTTTDEFYVVNLAGERIYDGATGQTNERHPGTPPVPEVRALLVELPEVHGVEPVSRQGARSTTYPGGWNFEIRCPSRGCGITHRTSRVPVPTRVRLSCGTLVFVTGWST